MKFTREQFNELGEWYMDDLPFNLSSDDKFRLFNLLTDGFKGEFLSFGFDDTVTRDSFFEWILDNQFNLTPKEYKQSDIYKSYEKGIIVNIIWDKIEEL